MIVALVVILSLLVAAVAIGHQLEKAPEGFQDKTGFHFTQHGNASDATVQLRANAARAFVGREKRAAAISLL